MSTAEPYPEPMRASYGERFHCVGTACEENCCQGWGISVDRPTFDRYMEVPELAARIGGLAAAQPPVSPAILVRLEPTLNDHARIQLLPSGLCPFLDEDKLCGIQKQHGEAYLPEVCASYPRAQRMVFGTTERALHLSCPEAARLVLLDPNLLDLGSADLSSPEAQTARAAAIYADFFSNAEGRLRADDHASSARPHLHLQVRDLVLLLLMDRRYLLWQRLFLLGIFCSRLGQTLDRIHASAGAEAKPPQIPEASAAISDLLADCAILFASATLMPVLSQIQPQPEQQLATVFDLLRLRLTGQAIQPRLLNCLQRFELGLNHPAAPAAEQLRRYNEAAALYYRPLMERHPYVLENYLANYVFKNRFPFGHGLEASEDDTAAVSATHKLTTPQLEHLTLSVHYMLVQGLLIGISAHHRERFSLNHVVELIQCLSKAIDHNAGFLKTIARYAAERGLESHEGMAMVVAL